MVFIPTIEMLLGGWGAFAGTHFLMSHPPNRKKLVSKLGMDNYKAVYSGVAVCTFVPLVVMYSKLRHSGSIMHSVTSTLPGQVACGACSILGGALLGLSLMRPGPTSELGGTQETRQLISQEPVIGADRITRHPMLMGLGLLGLAQAMKSGHMADVAFWLPFPFFSLAGAVHQDKRQREFVDPDFYKKTSLLPFAAIIEGRNEICPVAKEIGPRGMFVTAFGAMLGLKVVWPF